MLGMLLGEPNEPPQRVFLDDRVESSPRRTPLQRGIAAALERTQPRER